MSKKNGNSLNDLSCGFIALNEEDQPGIRPACQAVTGLVATAISIRYNQIISPQEYRDCIPARRYTDEWTRG
ncbi:hypothetical protein [Pantoea piersonii]|uniref:hypothetical protein n=1 Tax=Pantoea piersonii TaxID=2364647 RepID=UPI002FD9F04E